MADTEQRRTPALLISPHLDDAVLSCGRFIAARPGCTVLTALAGSPPEWTTLTGWDSYCGFALGEDVVAARLLEDARALERLGGRQLPVGGLDHQYIVEYGPQPERAGMIREGIESALTDLAPIFCVIPLGLAHPDHEEVRRIAALVAANAPAPVSWIVYEDLPYGPSDHRGEDHDAAFAAYHAAGLVLTEFAPELGAAAVKSGAVERYESQLRGLRKDPDFDHKIVSEKYWSVSPIR